MQELPGGDVKLAEGSVGREEWWKDGLRGSLGAAALMVAALAVLSKKRAHGTRRTGSGATKRSSETSLSLEGRVWASQGEGEGEVWSTGSSRRRRGGSATILGERAVDCDAW